MTGASDWTGRVGDVWAAEWQRTDRSFSDLSQHLNAAIRAVAPETGHALDIGCGAGATSLALADVRPEMKVTGVDLSEGLIAVSRGRAAGRHNLGFEVGDAGGPAVPLGPFDLLFSRHGVMFFADPVAGFTALLQRAAPAAPLVFSCFRAATENAWATELVTAITGTTPKLAATYAPGPFGLADHDTTAAILAQSGWRDATATAIDFTYIAGGGPDPVGDALSFFTRIGPAATILAAAPPQDRPALQDRLRAVLARRLTGETVTFPAAAWIWSAHAGAPQP